MSENCVGSLVTVFMKHPVYVLTINLPRPKKILKANQTSHVDIDTTIFLQSSYLIEIDEKQVDVSVNEFNDTCNCFN